MVLRVHRYGIAHDRNDVITKMSGLKYLEAVFHRCTEISEGSRAVLVPENMRRAVDFCWNGHLYGDITKILMLALSQPHLDLEQQLLPEQAIVTFLRLDFENHFLMFSRLKHIRLSYCWDHIAVVRFFTVSSEIFARRPRILKGETESSSTP